MRLDDKLSEMFDEVDVPDELLPQNIALMLKAKANQSKMTAEHKDIKSAKNIAAQRHTIIMRTAAATAACAVFAVGMLAYNATNKDEQIIDPRIDFEAITPNSYANLHDIYTGISLESSSTEGSETDKNTGSDTPVTSADGTEKNNSSTGTVTEAPITTKDNITTATTPELLQNEFTDCEDERIAKADIVKSDGTNLYCISDGVLYVVNLETMEVVTTIEHNLNLPVELYIDGEILILISKETDEMKVIDPYHLDPESEDYSIVTSAPLADETDTYLSDDEIHDSFFTDNSNGQWDSLLDDQSSYTDINNVDIFDADSVFKSGAAYPGTTASTRSNVIVDIYDISDKTLPVHTTTYKQNGSYIYSGIVDKVLYMVSDYSDYRTKPLDAGADPMADLESFVPGYYLNNQKFYVDYDDIIIPSNANSTDYTVVSAIDLKKSDNAVLVKAVLGSSKNVCCSADSIYIVGVGKKDSDDYSIITRFSLGGNDKGLTYKASAAVQGRVLSQYSLNAYNNMFRIATVSTDDTGLSVTSVFVLDETLAVTQSAGQLLPNQNVSHVRFEENYASLYLSGKTEPAMVLDLNANPPIQAGSLATHSAYLYKFSSDELLGLSYSSDKNELILNMYDSDNGLLLNKISFADGLNDINSAAFTSKRALFIDVQNSLVGVPVYSHNEFGTVNQYYVFSYDKAGGFTLKGVIEYNDIDDSSLFERAVICDDILYVIGNGRIVSAQLSDLKVIDSITY